jgi:hypothetical protein
MHVPELPEPRPGKSARNERRKLLATTLNAVGLAIFALGGLTPIFSGVITVAGMVKAALSTAIFVFAHLGARALLGGLED